MAIGISSVVINPPDFSYPTPYLTYTATGLTAGMYLVCEIEYEDSFFGEYVTRNYDHILLTGTTLDVQDHEIAPGIPFRIRISQMNSTGGSLTTESVGSNLLDPTDPDMTGGYYYGAYLRNVANPAFSQKLWVGDFSELQQDGKILSSVDVIGQSLPVVIEDGGGLGGRSGSFTCYGRSNLLSDDRFCPTWQEMENLLLPSGALLFQPYFPLQTGIEPLYLVIKSLSKKRVTRVVPDADDDQLLIEYTVSFQERQRPSAAGVSGLNRTWSDVANEGTLISDIKSRYATYLNMLRGF